MNLKNLIQKRTGKKAFTLVELLVVIAIIGILFTVFISRVDFATDKAKNTGVLTDLHSYRMGLQHTLRENNYDLSDEDSQKAMVINLNTNLDKAMQFGVNQDNGEYQSFTVNPYGYRYVLKFDEEKDRVEIYSISSQREVDGQIISLGY